MPERKPEWQVIIDLLRATDSRELNRISRKLLNKLVRMEVKGAIDLLERFDQAYMNTRGDENQPSQKTNLGEI